jgi:GNAT superfamily N-acetyltransferase
MTKDRARQIELAKADYVDAWLQAIQGQMKTFLDIDVLRRGNVRALVAPDLQEIGLFNLVSGLSFHEKDLLEEILRFYQGHDVEKYYVEINPYFVSSGFLGYFASKGFTLSRFETYVYGGVTSTPTPASTSISIRDVTSSEVDLFADLHIQGYQEALARVSETTLKLYRECLKVLYGYPGWHLSIAWIHDIPCGMGMLYMQDGRASLAGGATLPNQRHHGIQTALLRHRIQVAAQNQCTLIVGQANVGSTSQQNMERLGLRTAYTGSTWTRL